MSPKLTGCSKCLGFGRASGLSFNVIFHLQNIDLLVKQKSTQTSTKKKKTPKKMSCFSWAGIMRKVVETCQWEKWLQLPFVVQVLTAHVSTDSLRGVAPCSLPSFFVKQESTTVGVMSWATRLSVTTEPSRETPEHVEGMRRLTVVPGLQVLRCSLREIRRTDSAFSATTVTSRHAGGLEMSNSARGGGVFLTDRPLVPFRRKVNEARLAHTMWSI